MTEINVHKDLQAQYCNTFSGLCPTTAPPLARAFPYLTSPQTVSLLQTQIVQKQTHGFFPQPWLPAPPDPS